MCINMKTWDFNCVSHMQQKLFVPLACHRTKVSDPKGVVMNGDVALFFIPCPQLSPCPRP